MKHNMWCDRSVGFEALGTEGLLLAPLRGALLRAGLPAPLRGYGAGGHRRGGKQGADHGLELVFGNLHGFDHGSIVQRSLSTSLLASCLSCCCGLETDV